MKFSLTVVTILFALLFIVFIAYPIYNCKNEQKIVNTTIVNDNIIQIEEEQESSLEALNTLQAKQVHDQLYNYLDKNKVPNYLENNIIIGTAPLPSLYQDV